MSELEVSFHHVGADYRLTGRLGPNGPELTGVEITSDRPLGMAQLRAPLVSTFVNSFAMVEGQTRPETVVPSGRPRDAASARSQIAEVAEVARSAPYGSRTQAVSDHFGISRSYARQLISRAGQAGFAVWK